MSYTLDSNILIGLMQRYPRDIFPGIWDSIEESIAQDNSCISEAVHREIKRGGDDLYQWADNLPGFVCSTTDKELATVAEIAAAHPGWVQGQLNEADPFVVAHAKVENSRVVTEEKRKGSGTHDRNLKIPNVADEHEVEVLTFFNYVRREGWSF